MTKCTNINQLLSLFNQLGIVDSKDHYLENPNNPQILAHGTRGNSNTVKSILKEGLYMNNPMNEVISGVLSTNLLIDPKELYDNYLKLTDSTPTVNGVTNTIISIMPNHIKDIYLGKIIDYQKKYCDCCVLDGLDCKVLPTEFIVGVLTSNPKTKEFVFTLNPKFYGLNQENYDSLENKLKALINNSDNERLTQFLNFDKDSMYYQAAHNKGVYDVLDALNQLNPYLKQIIKVCQTPEYEQKVIEHSKKVNR